MMFRKYSVLIANQKGEEGLRTLSQQISLLVKLHFRRFT